MSDQSKLADLVVGDRFWLAYAQDLVRAAITAPERRAEQLSSGIAWFWTIYSSAALVALAVGGARFPTFVSILVATPTVLLVVAYWMAGRVRRPVQIAFDPRVPAQIESAHTAAAEKKATDLRSAELVTALAAASVLVALLLTLLGPTWPSIELAARADPDDPNQLIVLAAVPPNALVLLTVRGADDDQPDGGLTSLLERADGHGVLRVAFPVDQKGTARVTATWTEDAIQRSATVTVDPGG